jgi:hypothetical protein
MFRRFLFCFFTAVLIVPVIANAQSKPKRDTSKDRSVIMAKQQKKALAESQKVKQKNTNTRSKQQTVVTPKYATYLLVDQQTSLTVAINSYSGNETYNVSTDGKEWSISHLPSWCRITKYANSFSLYVEANPLHEERADWFKVTSDNKEVIINIKQSGKPLNIAAHFNDASLQHNVLWPSQGLSWGLNLKINTDITISGARGLKCMIVAFISDENNYSIKATSGYSNYAITASNNVYAATEVTPSSDDAQRFNVEIYLPNNAMKLPKKQNKLRCHLAVYCDKTAKYIIGADYTLPFKAKNKKGRVTTKDL